MSTIASVPHNLSFFDKQSHSFNTQDSSINRANQTIQQPSLNNFLEELEVSGCGNKICFPDENLLEYIRNLNQSLSLRHKIGTHFESTEKYGQGSFGGVFKIYDTQYKRIYAKKVIKANTPSFKSVILNEMVSIKYLTEMNHPDLVQIYCVNYYPNDRFEIIMEAGHGTFKEYLKFLERKKKVYKNMYHDIHKQLWNQLKIFHDNNICHRDIKPANIIWTSDNTFKLVDFGCSKKFLKRGVQEVSIAGTKDYMMPEMREAVDNMRYSCFLDPYQADEYALNKTLNDFVVLVQKYDVDEEEKVALATEFKGEIEYKMYKKICDNKIRNRIIPSLVSIGMLDSAKNLIARENKDLCENPTIDSKKRIKKLEKIERKIIEREAKLNSCQ